MSFSKTEEGKKYIWKLWFLKFFDLYLKRYFLGFRICGSICETTALSFSLDQI